MTDAPDIANRHMLQADGLPEKPACVAQRVRVVVGDEWASSRAGQLLVSCLVNLLVRQIGLISDVEVAARDCDGLIVLPNGEAAGRFPGYLQDIGSWAVGNRVNVTLSAEVSFTPNVTVMIGTTEPVAQGVALFALGNGWNAWIGDPHRAPQNVVPDSANPLGPFLAASLVAGEIFKHCRGLLRGRLLNGDGYSLWSGEAAAEWRSLQDGPELVGRHLSPIHIIGTGAVGNGLAYAMANARFASSYAVLIDDDRYDWTSLNRCLMAGHLNVGRPKVCAVGTALQKAGVDVYGFTDTLSRYLSSSRPGLRPDIAAQVDNLTFDVIASCVDRGLSRQHVQGLESTRLFGGSTLGLAARANFYPRDLGAACLACFNPAEQDGETLRALEKRLRAMDADERDAFLKVEGIDPKAVEEYLNTPQCGSLGEAALRDLATRSASEFSVGFVSLGAAVLLAAKLFQRLLFQDAPSRGTVASLNFKNGGYLDSFLGADENCEWGCQRRPRQT